MTRSSKFQLITEFFNKEIGETNTYDESEIVP